MQSTCIQSRPSLHRPRALASRPAFTLVELLVVIGIISLLISILMPVLGAANRAAKQTKCLSNMRNMAIAHCMYVNDSRGYVIQAGFGHGAVNHAADEQGAWFNTLQRYYTTPLLLRCPADESPHWEGGTPVPPTSTANPKWRRTSYGINNFLDAVTCPVGGIFVGGPYRKITDVRRTSGTIHFIEMTEHGEFAGSDHPHVENWALVGFPDATPKLVAAHMEAHQHGGSKNRWTARANYAFLDGHAASHTLREVFYDFQTNQFDPRRAP